MPPASVHTFLRPHRRDVPDSNSTVPGQRVSIDGGIDSKRNIIALILATVLFIVVVVLYQYISIAIARREEMEARGVPRHRRMKTATSRRSEESILRRVAMRAKELIALLKRKMPPSTRSSSAGGASSSDSMEALMRVRPRRPPDNKGAFLKFDIPCLKRRSKGEYYAKTKRRGGDARRRFIPRPFLIHQETTYSNSGGSYSPRSPIDDKTYAMLRSPDAFAEYSDPVRNMSFARMQSEIQRRMERDEVWLSEEPPDAPERPVVAAVAPLAMRKKARRTLVREGDDAGSVTEVESDDEMGWVTPTRVSYSTHYQPGPTRSSSLNALEEDNLFWRPSRPPQSLSMIQEVSEPEPLATLPYLENKDDDVHNDGYRPRQKSVRLRFPLPSPTKQGDFDAFSIGSFSDSSDGSESGH